MEVDVYPIRRLGDVLARHLAWGSKLTGTLSIAERYDPETARHVRTARLLGAGDTDLMPPLLDATVIAIARGNWTITGWERIDDDMARPRAYQQSWRVVPAAER